MEGPHLIAAQGSDEGAKKGTFIGAMGLKLYDARVQIDVDEEGEMEGMFKQLILPLKSNLFSHRLSASFDHYVVNMLQA